MEDDGNQVIVPASFTALFVEPGRLKPRASRDHIGARHEHCEDLAQALVETALARRAELGITEDDVLERIARGLAGGGPGLELAEAGWVLQRLAELLGWEARRFLPGPAQR